MKPLTFVLPESFHPGEFLKTPQLRVRWDDARYFIGLILRKLSRWDVDEAEGIKVVRLRAQHLKAVMHQTTYAAVIGALLDGGVVERFPYQVGDHSFGYRLTERFAADTHVRVPVTDHRLVRSLKKFHEKRAAERKALMKPVHHALANQQRRLRIYGDQAREILSRHPKSNRFDAQGILIADIENHEFHTSVSQYGRFFNNITSMKRECRDALHVEGNPLGYVDLRCCQPAFIARVFPGNTKHRSGTTEGREAAGGCNYDSSLQGPVHYDSSPTNPTNGDFERYRTLVQSGQFYDFMVNVLRDRGISRDDFKQRFLVDVIAKHGKYPSPVEDAFCQCFPSVYGFIRETNQQGQEHANLIRMLQRAESDFVIETVAADLVTRFPGVFFLPLHDAIFTTAEHLPKVEQAFKRAFQQTGFQMDFKTEYPNDLALSPTRKVRWAPGTRATDTKQLRPIRDSGQYRATMLRGPELASIGLGFRWPRLEAA